MVIELAGVPGAGKTTFAKRLAKMMGWKRVRIDGNGELYWYNFLFLLRHPVNALRQMVWLLSYRGERRRWRTKFMNLYLVRNARWMKARRMNQAIIDQGHLQNIVSLFNEAMSPDVIGAYLSLLPKPDHALIFAIPPQIAEMHMKRRGYGVREELDASARQRWLAAAHVNVGILWSIIRKAGVAAELIDGYEAAERTLLRFTAPHTVCDIQNPNSGRRKRDGRIGVMVR
jgi:hypothetical protein